MIIIKTFALALLLQQGAPETVDWDREFGVEKRTPDPLTGELPVAPYQQDNANAGAAPFAGDELARAFNGRPGIERIANRMIALSQTDPRISAIFVNHDMVRLRRTLAEQFCYLLNAGCNYSGRDMGNAHKDMGLKLADMNALVENLQRAMAAEGVPFAAQNRLLSKLAPMSAAMIER